MVSPLSRPSILLLPLMRQIYPLWKPAGSLITVIIFNQVYWLGIYSILFSLAHCLKTEQKKEAARGCISDCAIQYPRQPPPTKHNLPTIGNDTGVYSVTVAASAKWLETVTDALGPRHNQQAGVKLSSDGKPAVFWNGFTGGTERAIFGWIYLECSLTRPN